VDYWKSEDKNDMPPNISLQPTAPSLALLARSQRLSSVPLARLRQVRLMLIGGMENMNDHPHPATDEQKIKFLLIVLESEEKRRESIENRFSVLIASNAILLSVIIGWGLPPTSASMNTTYWLESVLTAIALSAVILSILWCAQILAPLGERHRAKIMDLGASPETEYNLILFTKISKYKKADYLQEINSLTQERILEQVTSQVHNVARLLNHRYRVLSFAHKSFAIGAILFAILALVKLFIG
jgi:hypothetical protein